MSTRCAMTILKAVTMPLLLLSAIELGHAQTSDDQSLLNRPYMLGDWGGRRTALERAGIKFNIISVNDFLENTRSNVANWSRVRGTLDIDFGKADLVQGLTFHITALWQGGGNMGPTSAASPTPAAW